MKAGRTLCGRSREGQAVTVSSEYSTLAVLHVCEQKTAEDTKRLMKGSALSHKQESDRAGDRLQSGHFMPAAASGSEPSTQAIEEKKHGEKQEVCGDETLAP